MVVVSFVMVVFWGLYYAVSIGLGFFCGSSVSLPHWASPHERLFVGSRHLLSSNSAALILVSSGEKKVEFLQLQFYYLEVQDT